MQPHNPNVYVKLSIILQPSVSVVSLDKMEHRELGNRDNPENRDSLDNQDNLVNLDSLVNLEFQDATR